MFAHSVLQIPCIATNRWGGVSEAPFNDFNLSFGVGDAPNAVHENRDRLRAEAGVKAVVSARQVHGDSVILVDKSVPETEMDGVDGLITMTSGLGLLIQHADCQAVVLYDPARGAVANIHCGWRGSRSGILMKAVRLMVSRCGSNPRDLMAWVSPSLGPCCAEFQGWRDLLSTPFEPFVLAGSRVDFWAATRRQLEEVGLLPEKIEISGICTCCSREYFSYRREVVTGRSGTVAMLP